MTSRAGIAAAAILVACATGAAAWAAPEPSANPGALPAVKVRDLHYGDVLFYFYQDDYFSSLIRLDAFKAQGRLDKHSDDAELLRGGLYLSLGGHKEAGRIFASVLDRPNVPQAVRDRARFYLGKVWYQRGYYDRAEATLLAAGTGTLSEAMEAERQMLLAQAQLYQGKFDAAIATLNGWNGPRHWRAYAQFNLGVAFVRSQRLAEGTQLLDAVGQLQTSDPELSALRDKANLALGYAYLQDNQPAAARPVLERVRLTGPMSNKALLGVGWAESAQNHFQEALVPWMELHDRNLLDSAVQESYLAVPYAFGKLGANRQAAEHYEAAIQQFDAESHRLDESIAAIQQGQLLTSIVQNDATRDTGWFWQLKQLPDAPESRYLYHLLAGHEFQEGLKNYRSLLFMERNLEHWATSLEAFSDMLATRRQRFADRLPQVIANTKDVDVEALQHERTELESKLNAAESSGDAVALGTAREREIWDKLERMEAMLAENPDDPELAEMREKHRLLKGVVQWQMNEGFRARAWAVRKHLRELAQAMRETQNRWALVEEAKRVVPARNADFESRIAALGPRVMDAQLRLANVKAAQGRYLADIAVRELEGQKERLAQYTVQARFALASIYDRASAVDGSEP